MGFVFFLITFLKFFDRSFCLFLVVALVNFSCAFVCFVFSSGVFALVFKTLLLLLGVQTSLCRPSAPAAANPPAAG